ncbi:MAG: hypothetical protein AAF495_03815 [Pseudomonadota bacterium]
MSFAFTITVVDANDLISGATEALLIENMTASLLEWGEFISGLGSVEVELTIDNTFVGTAEGGAATNPIVRQENGTNIAESTVALELRSGFDATGPGPDALITIDPDFLLNELWLDPTPFDRSDGPPAGFLDGIGLLSHEFSHTLGINGFIDDLTFQIPNDLISNYDEFVTVVGQQAFFNGPLTVEAYGGPLPLTSLSDTQNIYHFGDDDGVGPDLFGSLLNGTGQFASDRYEVEALTLLVFADLGLDVSIPDDLPFVDPFTLVPEPTLTVASVGVTGNQVSAVLALSSPEVFFTLGATVALEDASGTVLGDAQRVLFQPGQTQLMVNMPLPAQADPSQVMLVVSNPAGAQLETGTRFLTVNVGQEPGEELGTEGPDVLVGTPLGETLLALGGDDSLTGLAGNDILDGGAGLDTANFTGATSASNVSLLADGRVVVLGPDGRDVLNDVELLAFQDAVLETAQLATTPSPIDPGQASDVFRFFNTGAGGHFFTTDPDERDAVMALENFIFEGVGYRAIEATLPVEGASDVFRFFNTVAGGHFFTTDPGERDAVMAIDTFIFEGTGFQAFEEQVEGSVPVFRFFNQGAGGHFFSTDIDEVDVVEDLAGFTLEGVGFYAFPDDLIA